MNLRNWFRYAHGLFKSGVSELLSPPFCYLCSVFLQKRKPLCALCKAKIRPLIATPLAITARRKLTVHAVGEYRDPLRSFIVAKNRSDESAAILLAQLMHTEISLLKNQYDYLVPVPLHWTRYAWRGYNQAEVIAQELSRLCGVPVLSCVSRTRTTAPQYQLSGIQRALNVENVFAPNEKAMLIRGKKIILVDDVMTTGSTLIGVARALLPTRFSEICAVVGARTLL